MHATADAGEKARMGDAFPRLERTASSGQLVTIPDPAGEFVHLQFRRFAGCPICNLHHARSSGATARSALPASGRSSSSTRPSRNSPSTRTSCRFR